MIHNEQACATSLDGDAGVVILNDIVNGGFEDSFCPDVGFTYAEQSEYVQNQNGNTARVIGYLLRTVAAIRGIRVSPCPYTVYPADESEDRELARSGVPSARAAAGHCSDRPASGDCAAATTGRVTR